MYLRFHLLSYQKNNYFHNFHSSASRPIKFNLFSDRAEYRFIFLGDLSFFHPFKNVHKQDRPSFESSSYLNLTLRYLGSLGLLDPLHNLLILPLSPPISSSFFFLPPPNSSYLLLAFCIPTPTYLISDSVILMLNSFNSIVSHIQNL